MEVEEGERGRFSTSMALMKGDLGVVGSAGRVGWGDFGMGFGVGLAVGFGVGLGVDRAGLGVFLDGEEIVLTAEFGLEAILGVVEGLGWRLGVVGG